MIEKFIEWLDRAKSRVYGVFFFWVCIGLMPVIFTSVFVDQRLIYEKTHLLKNEYMRDTYFNLGTLQGWLYPVVVFIFAVLLTRLTIWDFPKWFVNRAHKMETDHQTQRDIYQIKKERELDEERKKSADVTEKVIRAETKVATAKKAAKRTDPTILWDNEYDELGQAERTYLRDILKCIYQHRGNVYIESSYLSGPPEFELGADALRFGDSRDLVKIVNNGSRIEQTAKGKFFASKFDMAL